MKSFAIFLLFFVMNFFGCEAAAKEVSCESVGNDNWFVPIGNQKTCYMNEVTTIDSHGFTIGSAKDETIGGLNIYDNKKVSFLPVSVNEKFPNLVVLYASSCSIKTISKENFKNFNKLKGLYLYNNKIETVRTNVFEDLTSLERLDLDGNKIKSIIGQTFQHLKKLTHVYLNGNECINEDFLDPSKITTLMQVVSQKCGFCRSDDATVMAICETSDQVQEMAKKYFRVMLDEQTRQIEMFNTCNTKMSTIEQLIKENAALKAELNAAEAAKKAAEAKLNAADAAKRATRSAEAAKNFAEARITFITEIYDKLDGQRSATFAAETKDLRDIVDHKTKVNEDFLIIMERKSAEINEKRQKIKELQETIETISECNCKY